jgi:hypothetical protein
MLGVITGHPNVSKGIITTTSQFAPRVMDDAALSPYIPYRLELDAEHPETEAIDKARPSYQSYERTGEWRATTPSQPRPLLWAKAGALPNHGSGDQIRAIVSLCVWAARPTQMEDRGEGPPR